MELGKVNSGVKGRAQRMNAVLVRAHVPSRLLPCPAQQVRRSCSGDEPGVRTYTGGQVGCQARRQGPNAVEIESGHGPADAPNKSSTTSRTRACSNIHPLVHAKLLYVWLY